MLSQKVKAMRYNISSTNKLIAKLQRKKSRLNRNVNEIEVKVKDERNASPNKYRVCVYIDSEMYHLGEDAPSFLAALEMYVLWGKFGHPFQIYNDQGDALIESGL